MYKDIKESDWKLLRKLNDGALDELCQRALSEVQAIASDTSRSHHERYLTVFRTLKKRDEEIAEAFNDLRRSNALIKLANMKSLGLVTNDELAQFSVETQDIIRLILGEGRK